LRCSYVCVDGDQRHNPASRQTCVASPSADTRRAVQLSCPPLDRPLRQTNKCLHVLSSFQRTGSPRPKVLAAPPASGEPSNTMKPTEPCQDLFRGTAKFLATEPRRHQTSLRAGR